MPITLTQTAARHVDAYAQKNGIAYAGIRLLVRPSGCSGWMYDLEYAREEDESDLVFESNGVKVFIDPKSYIHTAGTVLDYTKEGLQEGFKFNNPKSTGVCGCGESFKT